jgi:predicted glycoside hydrolase/deacetylase ChbG (UPF0249 family)
MKRLIINADDFGLTDGVCRGIVEAMERGLVSATSAMVCMPGAAERIAHWALKIKGRAGLHLQLTGNCQPCLPAKEIPSLVTSEGRFPRHPHNVKADPGEVKKEWRAQAARLRAAGVEPNHLDSHHHIHRIPEYFPVYAELAAELGIPARNAKRATASFLDARGVRHPTACITTWYGDNTDLEGLIACLEAAYLKYGENQLLELMCHPGYVDDELTAISTCNSQRGRELGVLTSPEAAEVLAEMDIQVVDWSVLRSS